MSHYNYDIARKYWSEKILSLPTRKYNPDINEYAKSTIIATGTYRGLKYDPNRAPYLNRPMWCLSPASPYNEIAMMFPAQSGKTFTANTAAMYYIECVPSEILYATSDETMAIKWLNREIEPRAAQSGIIFRAEVESAQSRRTGNTSYSKSFPGGNIDIASALSPAQLASATKRVVLGDEVDRWKIKLGEQGSVIAQLRARTQAWKNQAKIFWFSTPTTEDESVIFELFQQGTQELYFIPCPYCGTMQLLDFEAGRGYGLTWEKKNGRIYKPSIELICENKSCGRGIKESHKPRFLRDGEWRAQVEAEYEHMVSFNLNGLYSFQLAWYDMVIAYEEAQKDPLKKQDFDQLKMGRPHKAVGTKPKLLKVAENRGTFRKGEVPDGVLYLTAGIDVQEGSKNNPDNPPRLEMQVIGVGKENQIRVIDYQIFEGEIEYPDYGAWEMLSNYAKRNNLKYIRKSDGMEFPVNMIFIDSGDGNFTDVVYDFCNGWGSTFAIKGRRDIQKKKGERQKFIDEEYQGNLRKYNLSSTKEGQRIYLINTNYYKNAIYRDLNISRIEGPEQRRGFTEFYSEIPDRYFEQLLSEDKMADGSYNSHGRRNEALDTLVYARCAADVFLDNLVMDAQADLKQRGFKEHEIRMKMNKPKMLDFLIRQTARKK